VSIYPITGEIYAAGYRWREEFESAAQMVANGAESLAGLTFGTDGAIFDGASSALFGANPWTFQPPAQFIFVEFKPGFLATEATTRYFFGSAGYSVHRAGQSIIVTMGGTVVLTALPADYAAAWREDDRNTLIVSATSGNNDLWLNGVLVKSSATAWAASSDIAWRIGADSAGANHFLGTMRSLHVGDGVLEQADVDHLHAGTLMTAIAPSEYLLAVPGDETHLSGADTVTRVVGTSGITEAVLGAGAAQPSGPDRRMFKYDGGDSIIIQPNERIIFTDGLVDIPFSVSFAFMPAVTAGQRILFGVTGGSTTTGEWYFFTDLANGRLYFRVVDNAAPASIGRRTADGVLGPGMHVAVGTYDGSAASSGIRLYLDCSGRVDSINSGSGVYTRLRNTGLPLQMGNWFSTNWNGLLGLQIIQRGALSPMQANAMCHRLGQYINIDDTSAP
jgi:hypothetical protein